MSGFRDVLPIVGPQVMMNWRGILVNFLPEDLPESQGQAATVTLSLLTTCTLFLIWRGNWEPRSESFSVKFLATLIVTMFASYHNHIHSAALLLVPGMSLAAQSEVPPLYRPLSLIALYGPLALFFQTGSMLLVAWLFLILMITCIIVLSVKRI
jgi:hypothetical protein